MAFDDDPVLLDVSLTINRGERVGVIGANGAGKSVLGRVLAGLSEPTAGERWAGPSVVFGYLAQGHETEPPHLTPIEFVRNAKPMYEEDAVSLLGGSCSATTRCANRWATLSGGERTRLQLCLLMLSGANCLLLDEPTNHLDIESMEVLESALEPYDGTVIVISHDRYLLDRIPDRILEVTRGRGHLVARRLRRLGRSPGHAAESDMSAADLAAIERRVVACRACPRLVAWREQVAREKVARFADQEYWGRPVPGFGDPARARADPGSRARRPTGATGRAASSRATARATSCSPRCIGRASRTSPRASRATTVSA